MARFEEYYFGYLGIKNINDIGSSIIIESEYRDKPLNNKYYYPIIFTKLNEKLLCSCSHRYLDICQRYFKGSIESMYNIAKILSEGQSKFRLRVMRRYTVEETNEFYSNADVLTIDMLRNIRFEIHNNLDDYIERKKEILNDRRQFVMVDDEKIASTAFISDIHNSGCNIVVFTQAEYRTKGFGQQVVKACINWCKEHNYLPIYLVEETNKSSIKLAEKIGFQMKSREWIISE
ncbi:GNAT family N-acetyltransferase [Vallitalea okinawensis]|uniref:GNAT family N-acetyltransferase n=1 Tax=Vallitalea okinawensis TaxID=2078660 RepID=UPI00130067CA|nr:GNAT family N-acetyltransferase [Vallitalea okinawensis]